MVELLALLFRIRQVRGSDLGYSDVLRFYPQFLQTSAGIVHSIRTRPISSTSFLIHHSAVIISFDAISSELLRECREINLKPYKIQINK
jgi:hypothetical protein